MEKGIQKEIKLDELLKHMVDIVGEKNLDFYDPTQELIRGQKPMITESTPTDLTE